jgi:hypothetical protein
MKFLRRALFFAATCVLLVNLVILLDITAPNPTHRRHSSRPPLTSGQATANDIGRDAEDILARDLGLPRNDDPGQRRCV